MLARVLLGVVAVSLLVVVFYAGWLVNEGIAKSDCEKAEGRFLDAIGIASMPDNRIEYLYDIAKAECDW